MTHDYNEWLKNPIEIFCKCGCDKEIIIKKSYKYVNIPEYVRGHYWIKKHHSKETKEKLSNARKDENNPNFGRHHSEETKQKLSNAQKGRHHSEETKQKLSNANKGKKHYLFGKQHSEETKLKMSESQKGKIISEETKQKLSEAESGEKHYNWQGGKSFEPYCERWTPELREEIRIRDGNICQNCGKTEIENKNRKLSVHHVHYDKENCYPDLITLCCSCNFKVNFNRDYWEEHFMKILKYRDLLKEL